MRKFTILLFLILTSVSCSNSEKQEESQDEETDTINWDCPEIILGFKLGEELTSELEFAKIKGLLLDPDYKTDSTRSTRLSSADLDGIYQYSDEILGVVEITQLVNLSEDSRYIKSKQLFEILVNYGNPDEFGETEYYYTWGLNREEIPFDVTGFSEDAIDDLRMQKKLRKHTAFLIDNAHKDEIIRSLYNKYGNPSKVNKEDLLEVYLWEVDDMWVIATVDKQGADLNTLFVNYRLRSEIRNSYIVK